MDLVWFLLIGLAAGFLASQFVKGSGMGLLGNLVLGVIGAFVGAFLFGAVGLAAYGLLGRLIMATVGAAVLLALIRIVKRA